MDLSERVDYWDTDGVAEPDIYALLNDLIADWKLRGEQLSEFVRLLKENESLRASHKERA